MFPIKSKKKQKKETIKQKKTKEFHTKTNTDLNTTQNRKTSFFLIKF